MSEKNCIDRIKELDSEVAELKESNSLLVSMNISLAKENSELEVQLQNWKDFSKKVQKIDFNNYLQLQASNNRLREALIVCKQYITEAIIDDKYHEASCDLDELYLLRDKAINLYNAAISAPTDTE